MAEVIFSAQTPHAGVRIERSDDELWLKFDTDTEAIQSALSIQQPHRLVMQNLRYLMGILQFMQDPEKILLLGVGGGSLVHFLRHYLPEAHLTGVEFDAALLDIAAQHLQLPAETAQLQYQVADARDYLERTSQGFDLIIVDIFTGGLTPDWLLNQQFSTLLQSRLTPRGGIAYNLLLRDENTLRRFYATLRRVYRQQTLLLETEEYANVLAYALNFSAPATDMQTRLEVCAQLTQRYELPFAQILSTIYAINPVDSGII